MFLKIIQFLLKILPSCLKNIPSGRLEMINCKILLCVFTLEAPSIDNNNALLAPPLLNTRCRRCNFLDLRSSYVNSVQFQSMNATYYLVRDTIYMFISLIMLPPFNLVSKTADSPETFGSHLFLHFCVSNLISYL